MSVGRCLECGKPFPDPNEPKTPESISPIAYRVEMNDVLMKQEIVGYICDKCRPLPSARIKGAEQ